MRFQLALAICCGVMACKKNEDSSASPAPTATAVISPATTPPVTASPEVTAAPTGTVTAGSVIKGFGYVQPNAGIAAARTLLILTDASGQMKNCSNPAASFILGAAVRCDTDMPAEAKTAIFTFFDASDRAIATYSGPITLEAAATKVYDFPLTLTGIPLTTGLATNATFKFFQDANSAMAMCTSTSGTTYQHGSSYQETVATSTGQNVLTRYCCQGVWSSTACTATVPTCRGNGTTYPLWSMVSGSQTDPSGTTSTTPFYCCGGKWMASVCQ